MSTRRQIEANRRNAQKSTGPTSITGKATSSMNALKTGIHAKSLVLPSEKLADLQQLIDEYYHRHQPASPEARVLLDDLIRCEWTLRRLGVAETQLFEYAHQEAYTVEDDFPLGQSCMDKHKQFGQLQWRIDSTRRALYRALHTLQQLESAPASAPPVVPDPLALHPPSLPPSFPNHFTPNRLRSCDPYHRLTPTVASRYTSARIRQSEERSDGSRPSLRTPRKSCANPSHL